MQPTPPPLTAWMCETCGTQHAPSAEPPIRCDICADERQFVGWHGQRWTTLEQLSRTHRVRMAPDDGLTGIGIAPSFAIDQRALVLPTASLRILWECTSLVTTQAVQALKSAGGIDMIAISHPHFYASMAEWSAALGNVPILLHEADSQWIRRPSSAIQLWQGEELRLAPGVTLRRCGGHFPGSTILHWRDAARPAGALFPGDALQVVQNRASVSFMYSYPNLIPLHPHAVRHIRDVLADLEFDDAYGFTWGRNIIGGARAAVDRSFGRYLTAIADAA